MIVGLSRLERRAGQADGLNSRTLEIFESLGFIEKVQKEGSPMVRIPSVYSF